MADLSTRDAKLVQYLNEAYGKERQLETSLEAHIQMTSRAPYRKRLQQHLRETKGHARSVEQRIKQLGGTAETVSVPGPDVVTEAASRVQEVAQRGAALAQGPLHAVRGTGEEEKLLKNAKTEFSDEAAEIAMYSAIETLAQTVGDRRTAQLARNIGRQEQRMASFLERLIPTLTKAVAQAEIPARERDGAGTRRRSAPSGSARRGRAKAGARRRATSSGASGRRRPTTARRGRATTSGRRRSTTASRGRTTTSGRRRSTTTRRGRATTSARSRSPVARRGRTTRARAGTSRARTTRRASASRSRKS
jgi:ferritin-like metal-binding protein YciE